MYISINYLQCGEDVLMQWIASTFFLAKSNIMTCKNCEFLLQDSDDFCNKCGAKVIKQRITVASLSSYVLQALGWESNFFLTLRGLLSKPHIVLREYIDGTRKKYANPFAFFAIMSALSLFVFTSFSEEFYQMTMHVNSVDTMAKEALLTDIVDETKLEEIKAKENPLLISREAAEFQLKYQNILSFLFLPLYALLAFLVFGKPYNFGEHLVVNSYLQGIVTLFVLVLFIVSIISKVNVFGMGLFVVSILYYMYAYKKLYNFTFGKILLKTLKFLGIVLLPGLVLFTLGFIYGYMASKV